jgi:hypothetical protein
MLVSYMVVLLKLWCWWFTFIYIRGSVDISVCREAVEREDRTK